MADSLDRLLEESAAYGEAPDIPFGYELVEDPDGSGETLVVSKDELCPACYKYVGADDEDACPRCGEDL